jgi:hypothetical protein
VETLEEYHKMPARFPQICVEQRILPEEIAGIRQIVEDEHPANAPISVFEAGGVPALFWKPGTLLHVKFLHGEPWIQQKVAAYANEWTRYANLSFVFDNHPQAQIRIAFLDNGSWSAVGLMALDRQRYPLERPTMNFGWLSADLPEDAFAHVVLHEFGHALGMLHEHQGPATGVRWNTQAVIDDLAGVWTREQIDSQIFQRYAGPETQFTAFDPESIMLYWIPAHWTSDGQAFPQQTRLSQADKAFMRSCYPGR